MNRYNKTITERYIISQKGIALLMVLWVLTILMVIVLSFSFMARTETHATLSFKSGIEKKFMAEAGIERGIMELFYRDFYKNQIVELEGREIWKTDGTPYTGQIGDGYYTVRVIDESGKVDINTVSDVVLKNLIVNLGIQIEEADIIVDSIMDWRDRDDLHRLHGAESDYYTSLPNPYKAKNARFDTLEELILVKGMSPEILYGNKERKGLIDFLTVNSQERKINVNAAPKEVLMAVPGMTPELSDSLITFRENKEMNDMDVAGILGDNYNIMMPYITTGGTETFTIEAFGHKGSEPRTTDVERGEKGGYAIRATVTITGDGKYNFVYYKSPITIKQ